MPGADELFLRSCRRTPSSGGSASRKSRHGSVEVKNRTGLSAKEATASAYGRPPTLPRGRERTIQDGPLQQHDGLRIHDAGSDGGQRLLDAELDEVDLLTLLGEAAAGVTGGIRRV